MSHQAPQDENRTQKWNRWSLNGFLIVMFYIPSCLLLGQSFREMYYLKGPGFLIPMIFSFLLYTVTHVMWIKGPKKPEPKE